MAYGREAISGVLGKAHLACDDNFFLKSRAFKI
jgi:hypothetical protein